MKQPKTYSARLVRSCAGDIAICAVLAERSLQHDLWHLVGALDEAGEGIGVGN